MAVQCFDTIQSVTDRQTDGRTDGHQCSVYTSACIACYATALVKIKLAIFLPDSDDPFGGLPIWRGTVVVEYIVGATLQVRVA